MFSHSRILCPELQQKIMTAEQAADFIRNGDTVGMSGFTGAGYPKALPGALVNKAQIQAILKSRLKLICGQVHQLRRSSMVCWPTLLHRDYERAWGT